MPISPNNLPQQVTSFIGRRREIAEINRKLNSTRLLTISGAGGLGKTRLALRVAANLVKAKQYPDGIWFIDLSPLADPALVPRAVASALGVHEQPSRALMDSISDYLRPLRVLLILDNCEHLIAACSSLVAVILQVCPQVRILATSRQALSFEGAVSWRVPSLSLPDKGEQITPKELLSYESVKLFADRAVQKWPGFTITVSNATSLAQLCRQLDGIPLALELAAARVNVLTVEEIAERLDDRFRLLTSGGKAVPPRHQTLRATLDWSYELLTTAEQTLLYSASIFTGGFTLEALDAVWREEGDEYETIDLLSQLVDKSLISKEERGGKSRYRLLETIREYAWGKLDASGELGNRRNRHLAWYLKLSEQAEPALLGAEQAIWAERLEIEYDNVRSALRWAKESGNIETGLRFAAAFWRFWWMRSYLLEGRETLYDFILASDEGFVRDSLGVTSTDILTAKTKALRGLGGLAWAQGDHDAALSFGNQSLAICRELGDKQGMASSFNILGLAARLRGDYHLARSFHEEGLAMQRELGDKQGMASSLNNLGTIAHDEGDYELARLIQEESLSIARELGDKQRIASSLNNLGTIAHESKDYSLANSLYQESLTIKEELGDRWGIAISLLNLGAVAVEERKYDRAQLLYKRSFVLRNELGDTLGVAYCLEGLGEVENHLGQFDRAAYMFGAAEVLREAIRAPLPPAEQIHYDHKIADARSKLDEAAWTVAWAEGRAMSLQQVIDFALQDSSEPLYSSTKSSYDIHSSDLTKREVEVLGLIAEGLSDTQVADRLSLSPNTVHAHLHRIYAKLNITTRSEATRYAIEHNFS